MNKIVGTFVDSPEELIGNLENYKMSGYQFRGHACENFILQPKAFRRNESQNLMKSFLCDVKANKWKLHPRTLSFYEKKLRPCDLDRVRWLTLFVMLYNYNLAKYFESRVRPNFNSEIKLDEKTQKYLEEFDSSHWSNESIFKKGVDYYLDNLEFFLNITGDKLIKAPSIITNPEVANVFTIAEELVFQHYGVSTAVLDWTANPDVAIYFSTQNVSEYAKYLSIFAYKQIENEGSPVLLAFESHDIVNERRKRQEGSFTYFTAPWSFYYFQGQWPSIEFYAKNQLYFEVVRYDISNNHENIKFFKKMLNEKDLTQEYLMNEEAMLLTF